MWTEGNGEKQQESEGDIDMSGGRTCVDESVDEMIWCEGCNLGRGDDESELSKSGFLQTADKKEGDDVGHDDENGEIFGDNDEEHDGGWDDEPNLFESMFPWINSEL